jgi:hypothetical protein
MRFSAHAVIVNEGGKRPLGTKLGTVQERASQSAVGNIQRVRRETRCPHLWHAASRERTTYPPFPCVASPSTVRTNRSCLFSFSVGSLFLACS